MISIYNEKPACILKNIVNSPPQTQAYCAGFELDEWWCDGFADNLMDWIVDYAFKSDEKKY